MSTGTEQAASTQAANGQAPPPEPGPAAEPGITVGERLMGVIGLAFAIGLALIGLDLITGGAVARILGARGDDGDAGSGG